MNVALQSHLHLGLQQSGREVIRHVALGADGLAAHTRQLGRESLSLQVWTAESRLQQVHDVDARH